MTYVNLNTIDISALEDLDATDYRQELHVKRSIAIEELVSRGESPEDIQEVDIMELVRGMREAEAELQGV